VETAWYYQLTYKEAIKQIQLENKNMGTVNCLAGKMTVILILETHLLLK